MKLKTNGKLKKGVNVVIEIKNETDTPDIYEGVIVDSYFGFYDLKTKDGSTVTFGSLNVVKILDGGK